MLTLAIKTENIAFEPDWRPQAARILQSIIDRWGAQVGLDCALGSVGLHPPTMPLRDDNGNRVGTLTYEPD